MKKFRYKMISLAFLLLTYIAQIAAYTDCTREVKNFFVEMGASELVWVTFVDGGSSVYKQMNVTGTTSGGINKLFSIVMAAQASGKKVGIRYPENNAPCPPPGGTARSDFTGIWLFK